MRIRFFNTYEPVTSFYRDLVPYLASSGHEVEIVISKAEYRSGRDLNRAIGHLQGIKICRTVSMGIQPNSQIAKAILMLAYIFHAALCGLFGAQVDLNVFLTQPPLFSLWGHALKILRRQKYCCVVMDIYPDLAVLDGLLGGGTPLVTLLTRISRFTLEHADGVIVIGRCMRQRVIDMRVAPERVHLIHNWTDEEAVTPISHSENDFRAAQGWQGKFVVLYSGNIGAPHYFDDILEVSRRLRDCTELVFAFIGHGQRRKEIEHYKAQYGLGNVVLLPFQPLARLQQSLSAGDVHFVSLRPGFEGLVVPSKAYGILAAGRPVLYQGAMQGEIAQMVIEEKVGRVVPPGDPDALEEAILACLYAPDLIAEQGKRAQHVAEKKYGKHAACRRYTRVLSTL